MAEKLSYQEKCENLVLVAKACLKVFACACAGVLVAKATKTFCKEMDNGNTDIAKEVIGKVPGMLRV
jgi:hypothetical protein